MQSVDDYSEALMPLRRWIFLMQQIHEAKYFIKRAEELGHPRLFVAWEPMLDFLVYFRGALNSYAKCFVSAGPDKIRLKSTEVFERDSAMLVVHERIIEIRNKYVAHSDDNEFESALVVISDTGQELLARSNYNFCFPFDRLYELRALIAKVETSIADGHMRCAVGMAKRIGKPVRLQQGPEPNTR